MVGMRETRLAINEMDNNDKLEIEQKIHPAFAGACTRLKDASSKIESLDQSSGEVIVSSLKMLIN